MKIERKWAMPNKDTFSIIPIKNFIISAISIYDNDAVIVDPFSKNSPFKNISITNDLDPSIEADYHLDALEFLKTFKDNSVDIVLFDPPYSPRQVSECYKKLNMTVNKETTQASFWSNLKKEISRIVRVNGCCISFGWNSNGIGKKYLFDIKNILLVAHGGAHNDTICVHEVKI